MVFHRGGYSSVYHCPFLYEKEINDYFCRLFYCLSMKSGFSAYVKYFFTIVLSLGGFLLLQPAYAQPCHLRISLITVGVGDELYATFGHTAIRVIDSSDNGDYIFNYGTFDFDTPHFYWKFIRGKLMYSLSVENFPDFMSEYYQEKRKVVEQLLNLTCAEKETIWQFLQYNYLPQNRDYKYDFLFDNCSTRIRDIFVRVLGPGWKYPNIVPESNLSFRTEINRYLRNKPWERLGINMMFGKSTDDSMNSSQIMFIPDYLAKAVGSSAINGKPLVEKTQVLYDPGPPPPDSFPFFLQPLFWLVILTIFVVVISFNRQWPVSGKLLPWIDRCLFFLSGLLGLFLLFMWFGTDHHVCRWNYNLLWAFPLNIIYSFYVHKNTSGVRKYAGWIIFLCFILLFGWDILPQQIPVAVLPIVAMLFVRAWHILGRHKLALK